MTLLSHIIGDTQSKLIDSKTIGQLIDESADKYNNLIAFNFPSEDRTLTFVQLKNEASKLAAGLLAIGLNAGDTVLLWGGNHADLVTACFACCKAGIIFSCMNPVLTRQAVLQQLTTFQANFKAIIAFPTLCDGNTYQILYSICPQLQSCTKGQLKCPDIATLTHVIIAEDKYKYQLAKYRGCFTLQDVYAAATSKLIKSIPKLQANVDTNQTAALMFTMGTTSDPKGVMLSHYQLINSGLVSGTQLGLDHKNQSFCCPMPVCRGPVFSLACLSPLIFGSTSVFPASLPMPGVVFGTICKQQCTSLLTHPCAFSLMLRLPETRGIDIKSLQTVCLVGDLIQPELIGNMKRRAPTTRLLVIGFDFYNHNNICMFHTESGCMPIMWPALAPEQRMLKSQGTVAAHYEIKIITHGNETLPRGKIGELLIRPIAGTSLIGYAGMEEMKDNFYYDGWMYTGDAAQIDSDNFVTVFGPRTDIILDKDGCSVYPWQIERALKAHDLILGACVVGVPCGEYNQIAACVVPHDKSDKKLDQVKLRKEITVLCKESKVRCPEYVVFIDALPRTTNRRVQRYKIRENIMALVKEQYPKHNLHS